MQNIIQQILKESIAEILTGDASKKADVPEAKSLGVQILVANRGWMFVGKIFDCGDY